MDLDSVLGLPRWKILELLAEKPLSPVEISIRLGTSVSYISQQLKLLEVTGFVKKEKTKAVEKGKPRSVYSIRKETAYIISIFTGGSVRKELVLDSHHKTIFNIWRIENSFFHYHLEKLFWKLEENIDEILGIYYKQANANKLEVVIVSDSARIRNLVNSIAGKFTGILKINNVSSKDFERRDLSVIYVPENSGERK